MIESTVMNGMKMLWRKIAFYMFFAGIIPCGALASMVYTPSRPCGAGCNNGAGYPYARQTDYRSGALPYHEMVYSDDETEMVNVSGKNARSMAMSTKSEQRLVGDVSKDIYVGINVSMNLWSWENKYNSDKPGVILMNAGDEYSFESVFGGSLLIGTYLQPGMRGDIELGINSEFSDADDFAVYKLSIPYLMANMYYDFDSGLYFGGGLGVARPKVTLDGASFVGKDAEKSAISPKIGIALGYATEISDNMFVDFRYRLSVMKGADISRVFEWQENTTTGVEQYVLQVENDLILENALSVGLRVYF